MIQWLISIPKRLAFFPHFSALPSTGSTSYCVWVQDGSQSQDCILSQSYLAKKRDYSLPTITSKSHEIHPDGLSTGHLPTPGPVNTSTPGLGVQSGAPEPLGSLTWKSGAVGKEGWVAGGGNHRCLLGASKP